MIQFKADIDQLKQLACKAINASKPVGLGFMHYKPTVFSPADIDIRAEDRELYIDYFQGRMVKLLVKSIGDNLYSMSEDVDPNYQSWAATYPTADDLLKASGITEYGVGE